ncbi:MAG: hypothetical protein Q7K55_04855 [Candidatus Levybacteria bacterium]|nr:hypothetical protein [Candidatus Levybacteria bacterium]
MSSISEIFKRSPVIAGPCGIESRDQALKTAEEAKLHGIEAVRLSLWKPRTKPGYDGVGLQGIPWLIDVARMGLTPATEVMLPSQAEKVIDAVIKNTNQNVLIWLGSRNQNQHIQKGVGKVIAGEPRVMLMIKNQPWLDKDHWEGIVGHVLDGGASEDQLLLCHRGFAPGTNGFRNTPDFEMALDLKQKTGLPIVLDPSHIGGSVSNVMQIAKEGVNYRRNGIGFNGLIVEVHPNPTEAKTDGKQQLTWRELSSLLGELRVQNTALKMPEVIFSARQ